MLCKQNLIALFIISFSSLHEFTEAVKVFKNTSEYCDICRHISEKFEEGIKNTARSNFGGGNTNWEERSLGKYGQSETRLVEILESCCDGLDDKTAKSRCEGLLEEHDEWIEEWWRTVYHQEEDDDDDDDKPKKNKQNETKKNLYSDFCVQKVAACCEKGFYGSDCKACPGGPQDPCNGNGICTGSGYKDGEGTCECSSGYEGEECDRCKEGFVSQDGRKCLGCHKSCKSTCTTPNDPKTCNECKNGWKKDEDGVLGCVDVNECLDPDRCPSHTYCRNEEGNSACLDCDKSCSGCFGPLDSDCKQCADLHYMHESTCLPCHKSCKNSCTDGTSKTCDSCNDGWEHNGEECIDKDECEMGQDVHKCDPIVSYCKNKDGSFKCKSCHSLCVGCRGPKPHQCKECKKGYQFNEDHECVDMNECEQEVPVCQEEHEQCVNRVGSFVCECEDGYVRRRGGPCQKKHIIITDDEPKRPTKEGKPAEAEKKGSAKIPTPRPSFEDFKSVTPGPNGYTEEDLKKLGEPLQGKLSDEKIVIEGKSKMNERMGGEDKEKTEL
ncbi:hypothetical protein HELRODRAFT_189281 [Helobdella robusta]|uniref:protein disulfide-isomerase n=1 Tax=Helobdella robusta TaxID=6412 RepID=T1FQX0_HELRO|nr:hypothetical protein HELRODRAFT_189281 [Helobdella robusta]ESN96532.1 hypothetical protein HELRODRAFT_189281 [Helobdella robusta]